MLLIVTIKSELHLNYIFHWWSEDIFSETETLAKTQVSIETWDEPRHFGFARDETRLRHSENVRDWDTAETQVSRHETSQNNLGLRLLQHAFTRHTLRSQTDCLTSTYYCHTVIQCHVKCWLHLTSIYWQQTSQNCSAQTVCVMSEVCIELRHTKTVMRQSQDETWSYETRAKTRHECVKTEPRQRHVNICLETSRDETRVSWLHHWHFLHTIARSAFIHGSVDSLHYCGRVQEVSILQGVKVSIFPTGNWHRRYNSAAPVIFFILYRSCVQA